MAWPIGSSCVAGLAVLMTPQLGLQAQSESPPVARDAPFVFKLSADPTSVALGKAVRFDLRLESHARKPWLVYPDLQEGPGASFELFIKDHATGEDVSPPFFADAHVPPGPTRLVKLLPKQAIEARIAGTPQHFGMQAGRTYDITAVYHSPLHRQPHGGIPVLSSDYGPVTSKPVHLTLEP